jgi:Domain of unknown function (DUF202)
MRAARDRQVGEPPERHVERTRFSWRRTVLALAVVATLAVRGAVTTLTPPLAAVTVAVAAGTWLAFAVLAQRRIGRLGTPLGYPPYTAAVVICLYAVLGAVLVLHPGR